MIDLTYLTQPPPDVSDRWNIEEGHTPEDAICRNRYCDWKVCFVAFRHQTFGESDKDIARLLKHKGGDIGVKRHRIYVIDSKVNPKKYRYFKISPELLDRWVDIAKEELTKKHDGDEEYAKSLLEVI